MKQVMEEGQEDLFFLQLNFLNVFNCVERDEPFKEVKVYQINYIHFMREALAQTNEYKLSELSSNHFIMKSFKDFMRKVVN